MKGTKFNNKKICADLRMKMVQKAIQQYRKHLGQIKEIKYIDAEKETYEGVCFLIKTIPEGKYLLKFSINFRNEEELEYLFQAMKEARKSGSIELPEIIPTDKRKPGIIEPSGRAFILYKFIEGRIPDDFDYLGLGKFLARFHNAILAFRPKNIQLIEKREINIAKRIKLLKTALGDKNITLKDHNFILRHIKLFQSNFLKGGYHLKRGVIHGDFNNRNVLEKNNKLVGRDRK